MPTVLRVVHEFNNTLLGRLLVGPLLGQVAFMRSDMREIGRGNMRQQVEATSDRQ